MRRLALTLVLAGSLLTLLSPAAGQVISGRIIADADTVGVDGADLTLLDLDGNPVLRTQSDAEGFFRIPVPVPGHYEIRSVRLGYSPLNSGYFSIGREMLEIELRMAETAIPIDPILVVARREIRAGTLDEFYDRMGDNQARGIGYFVTPEDIKRQESLPTSNLLRNIPSMEIVPSGNNMENQVWMRVAGVRCHPNLYLDGLRLTLPDHTNLDAVVHTMDLEGIEIYNRGHIERAHGYEIEPCGAILLWRKRDWGHPFSFGRLGLALGLGALLLLLNGGF